VRLTDDPELVARLRRPTAADPWRVLLSGCMAGWRCGVDATSYGMEGAAPAWTGPFVFVSFCPEDVGLGTPRPMPDLHGGDGFAALDGAARCLGPDGEDLTAGMIAGGQAMVDFARAQAVDFAVLTDMSAACGTVVLSLGARSATPRRYQRGVGIAAAMLMRAGIPVVSQRDFRTLAALQRRLDPAAEVGEGLIDHQHHPWVIANLP
jgi:uncharacterized protein YbbK (DUF523 family)